MRSVEGLHGAAAVTRAGSVELELAGGLADAGSGAECTPQTRFQIASVSKQFAATAVMLLAESGAVELGEPMARWLPGCPPRWRQVTPHHLLTHTAGVRHWSDAPGFDPSQPMDIRERLAFIQQAPLLTEPGVSAAGSGRACRVSCLRPDTAAGQPVAELEVLAVSDDHFSELQAAPPASYTHR